MVWRKHLTYMMDDSWPEDTDRRRVEDLQKFLKQNPEYLNTVPSEVKKALVAQAYPERSESTKQHKQKVKPTAQAMDPKTGMKRKSPSSNVENKWDLETTLELLETMKSYIIKHKMSCLGVKPERWMKVAILLQNPHGIELRKFARSCQVRFENIRRCMNKGKEDTQHVHILQSMREYWQICQRYEEPKARVKSRNSI